MFKGLEEAIKDLQSDAILTEFFPYINKEEEISIPDDGSGKELFGFEGMEYDVLETDGIKQSEILNKEEYLEELHDYLEDICKETGFAVETVISDEQLYKKYVIGVERYDIYGVVSLTETSDNERLVSMETLPEFKPPEGEYVPVDFATYCKSLSFLMPNIIQDLSVTTKMYDKYLRINKFREQDAIPNKFILESEDVEDCINELNDILNDFNITPEDIVSVMEDGTPDTILVGFYKEMMLEYDMTESEARGMLLHSLKRTVERYYERNTMSEYLETDVRILVNIETEKAQGLYGNNSLV